MINLKTSDTILDLKIKIYNQSSVDPDSQILLYGDKTLRHDSYTCQMENIKDGAKLQLVLDMNAGKQLGHTVYIKV
jgi:Ubiquitin family